MRGSKFEVETNVKFLRKGVFDIQNIVTIPNAKLIKKLGTLPKTQLIAVESTLRFWLGL
jgi:mRNA interferase MazF